MHPRVVAAENTSTTDQHFNYAEALQKTLYFVEAQQSGKLSPNNRVAWRGDACLSDGKDIQHDLSGGWFDAGDHWTANLTMSFLATTLAWSAIEKPDGWTQTGQIDELLESLIHVNRYFVKCVLNPGCENPATDLEVVIGCGGREGVENPNVHAMWGPAEVAHLMTNRPTFRGNRDCPAADIPAAMACAMTSTAMLLRAHPNAMSSKRGFEEFDALAFSDLLIERAVLLVKFSHANMGPALVPSLSEAETNAIKRQRNSALRADGAVVETGYRAGPIDKVFVASTWLARAAKTKQEREHWFNIADTLYDGPYKAEENHGFWKDYSAGNIGKLGAYNMLRIDPTIEKYHNELQTYCHGFTKYQQTPGGLRLREWFAHEYGSLRHANNAAVIALYYSELVESSPMLQGNTWWKGSKTNNELKIEFQQEAIRQVNYVLGDNPYGRSYLVGFGNQPFNHPHHRGAYGAWAGFDHFIPKKADDRTTCNHILYGAVIAGPDHNDVFLCGNDRHPWLPIPGTKDHGFFYRFPNRSEAIAKEGYQWDGQDQPYQDVMDSVFNEVALDYNAGFMASLAWLCAAGRSNGGPIDDAVFPPSSESSNLASMQPAFNRECFVTIKSLESKPNETFCELTIHNHSQWPARVIEQPTIRIYFTLDPGDKLDMVQTTVTEPDRFTISAPEIDAQGAAFVDIRFLKQTIHPGSAKDNHATVHVRLSSPNWDRNNDSKPPIALPLLTHNGN